MISKKMFWMGAAGLALATLLALTGCSARAEAPESGHGAPRRLSSDYQAEGAGGAQGAGRGRWATEAGVSDEVPRVTGRRSTDEVTEPGAGGGGRGFLAEEKGALISLRGVLSERDEEWYLETDDGVFQLGFGRKDYRDSTGIPLAAGAVAEVRGHLEDGEEISIVTCDIQGTRYTFRTEEGVPLWSGRYRAETEGRLSQDSMGAGRRGGGRGRGSQGLGENS